MHSTSTEHHGGLNECELRLHNAYLRWLANGRDSVLSSSYNGVYQFSDPKGMERLDCLSGI